MVALPYPPSASPEPAQAASERPALHLVPPSAGRARLAWSTEGTALIAEDRGHQLRIEPEGTGHRVLLDGLPKKPVFESEAAALRWAEATSLSLPPRLATRAWRRVGEDLVLACGERVLRIERWGAEYRVIGLDRPPFATESQARRYCNRLLLSGGLP